MVLRLWYAPRRKFFDTLADDCLVEYTPFASKGGDKWRCPGAGAPRRERIVLHCAQWAAHGRLHSYRFHPTDNRGRLTGSAVRHARGRIFYPIPTTSNTTSLPMARGSWSCPVFKHWTSLRWLV